MCEILYLKVVSVNDDDSFDDDLDPICFPIDHGGNSDSLQAYVDFYGAWFPQFYPQLLKDDVVGR